MPTLCLFCHRELKFDESLKGKLFCSSLHRELYLQQAPALSVDQESAAPPRMKYAPRSESIRRIRASLDRQNAARTASATAAAVPAPLAFAASAHFMGTGRSLETPLRQSFSPSLPGSAAPVNRGPAPVPFPDQTPQAPLNPPPAEPIRPEIFSRGLDSASGLASIWRWVVSGVVTSLTVFAIALPFPSHLAKSNGTHAVAGDFSAATIQPSTPPSAAALVSLSPVPESSVRHVSINATQIAWVSACADGREILQELLSPGDASNIDFANRAIVRLGNAGGVRLAVDGAAIDQLGSAGEARIVELTQGGSRLLPLKPGDTRKDCQFE
jgi:Domain of unknown function (DUF4115)